MLFVSPSIRLFVNMFKREIDYDDGRILIISYMVYLREFWWPGWKTRGPWSLIFIIIVVMLIESNDETVVGSCLDA